MVHSGLMEKPSLWVLPSFLPAKSRNSCLQWIAAGLSTSISWATGAENWPVTTGSNLLGWLPMSALRTRDH